MPFCGSNNLTLVLLTHISGLNDPVDQIQNQWNGL